MTPHNEFPRRPRRVLSALALILVAMAATAGNAGAYVTPAAAEHAAERGATWFEANQQASGDLGSDWAMTALAAVGLNAADVSTSLADPSAQAFYLDEWQASGPGGAATDAERGILAGVAGGIQASRLAAVTDTKKGNLVARVAELFDGTQIGDTSLLNDDIFGVLALHQAGAPQPLLRQSVDYLRTKQLADGGWGWSSSPGATADIDMTGSALAAFCAAGVGLGDADLQQALALLHASQDAATGGFAAPPPFGIGVNTDTTAWVLSGLVQCGIDPQGLDWTTASGKTGFDYLLSMQQPDGHFAWTDEFDGGNFETYSSVRPLMGVAFSSSPPARSDGTSPAVRPAPVVADGTTVPITLVIDHGAAADDVRMCRVDVASGSTLEQVLGDAATPAGCVAGFAAQSDSGGTVVSSLNGAAGNGNYGWRASVDGSPPVAKLRQPIGFGDLVFLRYAATVANPDPAPKTTVPPLGKPRRNKAGGARVALRSLDWSDDRVTVGLRCPRGLGAAGCRGTVAVQFRGANGDLVLGGAAGFQLGSGAKGSVAVAPNRVLRQGLASGRRLKLRLTAVTRGEDGSVRVTHGKRFLAA
ncbi:MAG TPA: prenyltransferase/squalene oxidase repeat-containing protein [Solirubrobacterales bacterium]|jgi:hypothetical protein|nr:prenyltransferase/squalene oxidase repeat-containing protein [Solirubrobacterales bacterium]